MDTGLIWAAALTSGAVSYAVLVAVHTTMENPGSTAYEMGRMLPIAGGSAVGVALIARATSSRRAWPWWLITLAVFAAAAFWYAAVEVVPRVKNDVRAAANDQSSYTLEAPARAGDWTRLDDAEVRSREQQMVERYNEMPEDVRGDFNGFVYGEYAMGQARLAFTGFMHIGAIQDEARDSASGTLQDFMAGSGAVDPQSVDPGALGGAMACTDEVPGLPPAMIYCAWMDASTAGQVTISDPGLDIVAAARFTRDFRDHVTVR